MNSQPDLDLFGPDALPRLRAACADLSWLLSRGYHDAAALKLCGDRHALTVRQRKAISRCACSDAALQARLRGLAHRPALASSDVGIDGLNILITLETALASGLILIGRDGRPRDLAGLHGAYKPRRQTIDAIELVGAALAPTGYARATWYLDRPVSHSGDLAVQLQRLAELRGWPWRVRVGNNPDALLVASGEVVISGDGWVLERTRWTDLLDPIILGTRPSHRALVVDLRDG